MDVVPAGVHLGGDGAGIWQAGLLLHGERIHVAADQQHRAVTVFHHGHHAVANQPGLVVLTDVIGNGVPQFAQAGCDHGRSLLFLT